MYPCVGAWKPQDAGQTLEYASDSSNPWFRLQLPSPPSAHIEDSLPTHSPTVGSPESPSVIDPEIQRVALSGPGGCREDCVLSLGRTRSVWLRG